MRTSSLTPQFVEFIPERPEPGVLYISKRYSTALHLCVCGCGSEEVTPLNPAKWRIKEVADKVSLYPSVGNWSLPCQSHYWIQENSIHWAEAMSPELIAMVKERDRLDVERTKPTPSWFDRAVQVCSRWFDLITGWLK